MSPEEREAAILAALRRMTMPPTTAELRAFLPDHWSSWQALHGDLRSMQRRGLVDSMATGPRGAAVWKVTS